MSKGIKKLLTLLMLVYCCTLKVSAQKVIMGMKVEPLLSWARVEGPTAKSDGLKPGVAYGLLADIKVSERYYVATELSVAYLGCKIRFPSATAPGALPWLSVPANNAEYRYQLQYLQVPVSFKFRTKTIGNFAYWAQFGFVGGMLLKAHADVTTDNPNVSATNLKVNDNPSPIQGFTDDVVGLRGAMLIGAGLEYPVTTETRLFAGLRFDNGFSDHSIDSKVTFTNSALSLNMGVFF